MQKEITNITIHKFKNSLLEQTKDLVATEEPLEISIAYIENEKFVTRKIAVTMRTSGNDKELALGFLFTENIINQNTTIEKIETKGENKICIFIKGQFELNLKNTERNFYTTSSCGVCGKASLESIKACAPQTFYPKHITIESKTILHLKEKIISKQSAFDATGGIHASGLFDIKGNLQCLFEDVGRHNALDKLIGNAFLEKKLPLDNCILFLSGRASFELLQKAAMANIPIVCALGAPSSLAVQTAEEMDITLIGFLKNESFNIYSGKERVEI